MKTLAKTVRDELKKAFPAIEFTVISDNYSGGQSLEIYYVDGPTTKEIKAITDKYLYGRWNDVIDSYDFTNQRGGIPQAKYIQINRESSESVEIEREN